MIDAKTIADSITKALDTDAQGRTVLERDADGKPLVVSKAPNAQPTKPAPFVPPALRNPGPKAPTTDKPVSGSEVAARLAEKSETKHKAKTKPAVNVKAVAEKVKAAKPKAEPKTKPQVSKAKPKTTNTKHKAKTKHKANKAKTTNGAQPGKARPDLRDVKRDMPAGRFHGTGRRLTDEQKAEAKKLRKANPKVYSLRRLGLIYGIDAASMYYLLAGGRDKAKARTAKRVSKANKRSR